ncbi:helix-turn-helix transcriptional regulator [Mycolicibacterium neworleansense]|uniref:TetR family transcriptional regulator n=2 Tax=Mycolicibacterium neworleansense TaxID=146018 RepID=A0A0H5RTF9_9MYCO|nr:helix-turn-helix transcriptional regulator [Mycolicibacterium neworleansense]CRZ17228.1 TetR family transcriptional regulator [Mycolicibacterium neworleansense]
MAAFDLLGRRWAITVLWELRGDPVGFRDLRRSLAGISSSVLSTRLRELTAVGVAETVADRKYRLTPIGIELLYALAPLKAWSRNWAQHLGAESFGNNPVDDVDRLP